MAFRKKPRPTSVRGKHHPPKGRQTFRNFGAQIDAISFDTVQRYGTAKGTTPGSRLATPLDGESWFALCLAEWRELNCTSTFAKFVSEVWSLCGSLPQLLFHRDEVVKLLVEYMAASDGAAAPLSALTASLVRDLGEEAAPFFGSLFSGFVTMLGSAKNAESIEVVLGSLFYFVKTLSPEVDSVIILQHLMDSLLLKMRPQVQDFLAEFAIYVLNKSYDREFLCLLLEKLASRVDICACILAGVALKSDSRFADIIILVQNQNQDQGQDKAESKELLRLCMESMVARSNATTACGKIAKCLKTTGSSIFFVEAFTLMAANWRLVSDHAALLNALATLPSSEQVQDAVVATVKLCNLQIVLQNRAFLQRLLCDPRGVRQACLHCPNHVELIIGVAAAMDIVAQQIFPAESELGISLMKQLLELNASTISKIPVNSLKMLLGEKSFVLTIAALKLLSNIPSVTELEWVNEQVGRQELFANTSQWITVLYEGRRFITCDLSVLLPSLENVYVLDILKASSQLFDESSLVKLLVSSDARRRLSVLQLLSRTALNESALFKACLALESIPWTFNCDREKGLQLQVIGNLIKKIPATTSLEVELVVRYLFGVLLAGFQPLKKELYITLSIVVEQQVKVSHAVCSDLIKTLQNYQPIETQSLSDEQTDKPMFSVNSLTLLLGFFAHKPASSELIGKEIVPLIHCIFCHGPFVDTSVWFRGQLQGGLGDLITAIGGLRSFKGDATTPLGVFLFQFLAFGDSTIQRRALDSILALGLAQIGLYGDRLRRLLDDVEMRDELVLLAAEKPDDHVWSSLADLLNRVLYGRIISKKGTAAGRNSMSSRRKLILNYIACWDVASLDNFVNFIGEQSELKMINSQALRHKDTKLQVSSEAQLDKWIGCLNLLQTILLKVGKKISQSTLDTIMIWFQALHTLDRGANEEHNKGEKLKKIHRLTLKRLRDVFMIASIEIDLEKWFAISWKMVAVRVSNLEHEFVQESSALLDLLHWWASEQRFRCIVLDLGREMWPRLVAALGGKARESVLGRIIDIWMLLLKRVAEKDQEAKNILTPLVGGLCEALDRRVATSGALTDRVIILLLELSLYIEKEEHKLPLISSMVKLLSAKSRNEQGKIKMLQLAAKLHVPALHQQVYRVACEQLGQLRERESRAALAALFQRLAQDDAQLVLFSNVLADLHAPSKDRLGEYDYERQTNGFSRLREAAPSQSQFQWIPVLNAMIYFCTDDEDTAARTLAFTVINLFVQRVSSETGDWMELLMTQLYPALRRGLTHKFESVRVDFVNLLNTLVEKFRMVEPFSELVPLLADDNEDANVLLNLLHLQQHRRARALKRLAEFASNSFSLNKRTIDDLLVPILRHFVMSDPTSRDPVPPLIVHDATLAMAALYAHLPVKIAITRIDRLAALIAKGTPCEKAILRLIPATCAYLKDVDTDQGTRLISTLFDLLMNRKSEVVRAPIAISIAELFNRIPSQLPVYLPKIVMSLGVMLGHKHSEKREEARETLKNVAERLGSDHLPFIVKELKSCLSSGYLPHLLAYTINGLLVKMNCNLDNICGDVTSIAIKDVFGERAKEKTMTEWTGKMMEVKAQKSYETLSILMTGISTGHILSVLEALREAVGKTENADWVEKACKAVEDGLIKRTDTTTEYYAVIYALLDVSSQFYTVSGKHWALHSSRFQLIGARVLCHVQKQEKITVGLLGQFIPHLTAIIFTGRSNVLMTAAIKTLSSAVSLSVLDEETLQKLLIRLFEVIIKTDAARHVELVNATFKLICTLVRERDDVQLEETQLRALLEYIRSNLESETNAPIAYTLIKAILRRRIVLVEVYELMSVLSRTMLRSFHPSTRQQCRAVVLTFLLDYPMARSKLDEYLSFFPANLAYEGDSGRESVALFLASLASKIPVELVQEMAETWLVALAARLVNECNEQVITAVVSAIKSIVRRLETRLLDRLALLLSKWLGHSSETVQKTGWALAPLVIRHATMPVAGLVNRLIEFIDIDPTKEMLITLTAIIGSSPTAIACDKTVVLMSVELCADRRVQRNQLIGEYFAQIGNSRDAVTGHSLSMNVLTEWLRVWLKELQQSRNVTDTEQIVKNLLFVARQLAENPPKEGRFASLLDLVAKMEKIYRQLPTGSVPLFSSSILKFYAALIMTIPVTTDLAKPIISAGLRILDDPRGDSPMAHQVLDLLAGRIEGFDDLKVEVLRTLDEKRRKRKVDERQLAVVDPRAYSKRRLQRSRKNRH